jgi:hypothetical protein
MIDKIILDNEPEGACIRKKRIVRPSRPQGNGERRAIFADVLLEEE